MKLSLLSLTSIELIDVDTSQMQSVLQNLYDLARRLHVLPCGKGAIDEILYVKHI